MKSLFFSRTLIVKLSHPPFSQFRHPTIRFHLLHHAAEDEAYSRRYEGYHAFSSYSSSLSRRDYDEESRNVKVTVWWDFENCHIPGGVNVYLVSNRITRAIRSRGIKGPVTITAFGDVAQLSRATQEALTSTGICLTHVPQSGKNSSDRSFMADLIYWVTQNPPPAHFFLISGDRDFANVLHRLRMSNYNILIATTENASGVLCNAATIMWPWYELVRGGSLTVRHFNYPPDGLHGSWYGHYKGVLDDPFAETVQPTIPQQEESEESIYVLKPRPVPKAVVKGIHHVLRSYPEGISLSELRSELRRNSITFNRDFYGHKKFSHLLASLNLLKFLRPSVDDEKPSMQPPIADGQPLVVSSFKKEPEQRDVTPSPAKENFTEIMQKDDCFTLKEGDLLTNMTSTSTEDLSNCKGGTLNANASSAVSNRSDPVIDLEAQEGVSVPQPTIFDPSEVSLKRDDIVNKEGLIKKLCNSHPVIDLEVQKGVSVPQPTIFDSSEASLKRDDIVNKEGLIKKLWNSLTGLRIDSILKTSDNILELDSSRHEDSSKNAPNLHSDPWKPKDSEKEMHADESIAKNGNPGRSETSNSEFEQKDDLFGRILIWCKSVIYGGNYQDDFFKSCDKVDQIDTADRSGETSAVLSNHPASHELFSNSSFWDDLESFLLDPKGRHLILKSITREQLLQGLQNEGPSSLKELDDSHLSHLGDILISEKKWVEESAFQKFPYKLLIVPKNSFPASQSSSLIGLSSLFSANMKSKIHKESDQEKEATEAFKEAGISGRDEVISNCKNLLKELLEKKPTGFRATFFQSEFRVKYGYNLDYRAVGFTKLTKLMQIMPGIKVESSNILPSEECARRNILNGEEGGGKDSLVGNEELGAFSSSTKNGNDEGGKPDKGATFRPVSLSDDEYTDDSEEDDPAASDRSRNCKQSADDVSVLLKVLDSWDDKKEGCARKQQDDADWMEAYLSRTARQKLLNADTAGPGRLKTIGVKKQYSFVAKVADKKDFVAERILEGVKKSGDRRLKDLSK